MTSPWWDQRASELEQMVVNADTRIAEMGEPVTANEARLAAVQSRANLALISSYLSSLNRQANTIKLLLLAIIGLLIAITLRL